jgi:ribonuclease P protein component
MSTRRFQGRKALRLVLARGMRYNRPEFGLRCLEGAGLVHRLAVIYSKQLAPKAVERNRVKRVFFESARLILGNIAKPMDCVIIVRRRMDAKSFRRSDADALISEAMRKILSF